jgi:hypothetical protein
MTTSEKGFPSAFAALNCSTASRPSAAVTTSCPSLRSSTAAIWRMLASSSKKSTRAPASLTRPGLSGSLAGPLSRSAGSQM